MNTLSVPRGMRDFDPKTVEKRDSILNIIKSVLKIYNFQQIETPAMENLSTLTGKYGTEGDQLIFKILNSGNYCKDIPPNTLTSDNIRQITSAISSKGLRYDLTVPLARYVSMHRQTITFPFRRFQIQPVWRADRPQKGRYREFYQCDADILGTKSLFCESEIIAIIRDVCNRLRIPGYRIRVNHRGILSGLANILSIQNEHTFFSTLDKWDKIGGQKVYDELIDKGVDRDQLKSIFNLFQVKASNREKISMLYARLNNSKEGQAALQAIENIIQFLSKLNISDNAFELDTTLARGLSYYTGTLFEVIVDDVQIGSIIGGGRYDNLTALFGLPNISGMGISFGIDRIYDVMEKYQLFQNTVGSSGKILITHLDMNSMVYGMGILVTLRKMGCCAELYPDSVKVKKQLDYANKNMIPFVIILGEEEIATGKLTLKNMETGEQKKCSMEEIVKTTMH